MSARHVIVLGGGVVGVASAWFLTRNGCRVTLIERGGQAALETSFANAGLITPSMSDPWASPSTPWLILKHLGRENSPYLIRPTALPGLASWGVRFLGQCGRSNWVRNMRNVLRLCRYSQECLRHLAAETGIQFDSNRRGTLRLMFERQSMDKAVRTAETLRALGVDSQILDPAGCIELEPALRDRMDRIAGGIHYPGDGAGDAHLFAVRLADICASRGVEFLYGESVEGIEVDGGKLTGVRTNARRVEGDACVVALGTGSAAQLRRLGIGLPIYPVKGYSVTFPVGDWNAAPRVPFSDDGQKVGVIRIGDRVRVAGTAEFAGYDKTLNRERIRQLKHFFFSFFPDYPERTAGKGWAGLRPMTPDGCPYLGMTAIEGLYLNTGHGHLGWTMACGSARIVADLICGRDPEIDLSGMTLQDR